MLAQMLHKAAGGLKVIACAMTSAMESQQVASDIDRITISTMSQEQLLHC